VKKILKILQPTQSEAKEAVPLSGDCSFVKPKTTGKSLQMRILDPVHQPGWDHIVLCIAMPVVFTPVLGQRCSTNLMATGPSIFTFSADTDWRRWFR